MPNLRATGPDGIPSETIKYCPVVKDTLFEIVREIWSEEVLSDGFAIAKFTMMLYKNKGSPNDPSN